MAKSCYMKTKILNILCLLVGLMFINAGLNKFFNYMPPPKEMPEDSLKLFTAMMQIKWLIPLIAVGEILGGLLFIIPKYRALGTLILFPIMVGILLTHFIIAPEGLPIPLVMAVIIAWVIFENRKKYLQLID
jgi:putative oxidoreductase